MECSGFRCRYTGPSGSVRTLTGDALNVLFRASLAPQILQPLFELLVATLVRALWCHVVMKLLMPSSDVVFSVTSLARTLQ